jgi:hypothetical protein
MKNPFERNFLVKYEELHAYTHLEYLSECIAIQIMLSMMVSKEV